MTFIHSLIEKKNTYWLQTVCQMLFWVLGHNKTNQISWPHRAYIPVRGMVDGMTAPAKMSLPNPQNLWICYLPWRKEIVQMWLKPWEVEIVMGYPGRPKLITWVLKSRDYFLIIRDRLDDKRRVRKMQLCWLWRWRKEFRNQAIVARKGNRFSARGPEGNAALPIPWS